MVVWPPLNARTRCRAGRKLPRFLHVFHEDAWLLSTRHGGPRVWAWRKDMVSVPAGKQDAFA